MPKKPKNVVRNAKGKFESNGTAAPKPYDDADPKARKSGYLRGRGESAGRKIALYSRSPKGLRVRENRSYRLARRLIQLFPFLEKPDFYLMKSFAQVTILIDECYVLIKQEGIRRKNGDPHRFLPELRNLYRVQGDLASRLGLTPRDRAVMKANLTDSALDLAELRKGADDADAADLPKRLSGPAKFRSDRVRPRPVVETEAGDANDPEPAPDS
jgi:hypothetical protein